MSKTKSKQRDTTSDRQFNEDEYELSDFKEDDMVRATKKGGKCLGCMRDNLFMILVLLGVMAGFGIGFGVKAITDSADAQMWIEMPGLLYIRLLDLTILPLIASNLIVVIANLNPKEQGMSSLITVVYILGFNTIGASVGTGMAALIMPGANLNMTRPNVEAEDPNLRAKTSDVFADLILNMAPDNIVGMCLQQTKTKYIYVKNSTGHQTIQRVVGISESKNLIGVLLVSIAFGLSGRAAGENGKAFLEFFKSLSEVVLKLVRAFLKCTPIGVCFMIAGAVMKVDNIALAFQGLGMFIVTVTAGIGVAFFLTLIIYFAMTFRNPFGFVRHLINAWFISFATTSPIVSLPEMFEGCDNYGIDPAISRFVCPISCALKADGPAIFVSAACMFVAQTQPEGVSPVTVVVIWLLTAVSAMAIPHIPSASIIITITILASAGIPTENCAYLYTVDWLLDRERSGFVTISTMFNTALVDGIMKKRAKKANQKEEEFLFD